MVRKEEDIPEVKRVVEQRGGEFASDFQAKRIALAYPIEHEKDAVFAFARFKTGTAEAKQLERDLGTTSAVLRSLITVPFKISKRDAVGAGKRRMQAASRQPAPAPQSSVSSVHVLSNEALTKKIEEMLK